MLDVIICANFGVEKLRGLGNTMGQILEFPIEITGHPCNRAGAIAQPVMLRHVEVHHVQHDILWLKRKESSLSRIVKYGKFT